MAAPTRMAVNVLNRNARPSRMPAHNATEVSVTSSAKPTSHSAASAMHVAGEMVRLVQQQALQTVDRHALIEPARHRIDVVVLDVVKRRALAGAESTGDSMPS